MIRASGVKAISRTVFAVPLGEFLAIVKTMPLLPRNPHDSAQYHLVCPSTFLSCDERLRPTLCNAHVLKLQYFLAGIVRLGPCLSTIKQHSRNSGTSDDHRFR